MMISYCSIPLCHILVDLIGLDVAAESIIVAAKPIDSIHEGPVHGYAETTQ